MAPGGPGIEITLTGESTSAQNAARSTATSLEDVRRAVERLTQVTKEGTDSSKFMADVMKGAAEEAKKLSAQHSVAAKAVKDHSAEQSKLGDALKGATDELTRHAGVVGNVIQRLGVANTVGGIFAVTIGAIGAAAVAATKDLGDQYQVLENVKVTTGLTADEFVTLAVAAEKSGKSIDAVTAAVQYFIRQIDAARSGRGESRDAFTSLGIDPSNIKDTYDGLLKVQSALNQIQDPQSRLGIGGSFFGSRGGAATMLAVLSKDLPAAFEEARRSGQLWTDAQIKQGQAASEATATLKGSWEGLKKEISSLLSGPGIGILDWSRDLLHTFREWGAVIPETVAGLQALHQLGSDPDASRPQFRSDVPFPLAGVSVQGTPISAAERQVKAFEASLSTLKQQVQLQPTLLDSALQQLATMQRQVTTQRELNRLLETAVELQGIKQPSLQGPPSTFFAPGGGPLRPLTQFFERPEFQEKQFFGEDPRTVIARAAEDALQKVPKAVEQFGNSLANTLSSAVLHVQSLDDAFNELFQNIVQQLAQLGVQSLLRTLFSVAGTAIGAAAGPAGAIAGGALGGAAGGGFTGGGSPIPGPRPGLNAATAPVEIHIHGLMDQSAIRQFVRKDLLPEIRDALASGAFR